MRRIVATILTLTFAFASSAAESRMVINIVANGVRTAEIQKFRKNFIPGGVDLILRHGVFYTQCSADYYPTLPESGLATISTGTLPSVHGVTSSQWYSRRYSKAHNICLRDSEEISKSPAHQEIENRYVSNTLFAETLSEAAARENIPVATVALNPVSAILLAGGAKECYWTDAKGMWRTGDSYTDTVPEILREVNAKGGCRPYASGTWRSALEKDRYLNTDVTDIVFETPAKSFVPKAWAETISVRPVGIKSVFAMATAVAEKMFAGKKDGTKVLNICVDAVGEIGRKYGHKSAEYEDAVYQMDKYLARFIVETYRIAGEETSFYLTFSSGCGCSMDCAQDENHRFDTAKAAIILNAFLSAQHGQDNWILGIHDGSVYLNHEVIYRHHCSIAEIRSETATFILQLRHVASSITADALQCGSFSKGAMHLVQNGFNQIRSGDIIYQLLPSVIEVSSFRASPGSLYGYDRMVPVIICGGKLEQKEVDRRVSLSQVAPTLARIMGIPAPASSDSDVLKEIFEK